MRIKHVFWRTLTRCLSRLVQLPWLLLGARLSYKSWLINDLRLLAHPEIAFYCPDRLIIARKICAVNANAAEQYYTQHHSVAFIRLNSQGLGLRESCDRSHPGM